MKILIILLVGIAGAGLGFGYSQYTAGIELYKNIAEAASVGLIIGILLI